MAAGNEGSSEPQRPVREALGSLRMGGKVGEWAEFGYRAAQEELPLWRMVLDVRWREV